MEIFFKIKLNNLIKKYEDNLEHLNNLILIS